MAVTYFGNNDTGNAHSSFTASYTFAIRALNSTVGTLTEIGVNIYYSAGTDKFRLGIYADSAGPAPGARLLDAGEIIPANLFTGWASITGLSLAVTSGYYWIAFNNYNTADTICYNTAKDAVYTASAYGALEDPYGTATAFPAYGMSLRAGVTPGGNNIVQMLI